MFYLKDGDFSLLFGDFLLQNIVVQLQTSDFVILCCKAEGEKEWIAEKKLVLCLIPFVEGTDLCLEVGGVVVLRFEIIRLGQCIVLRARVRIQTQLIKAILNPSEDNGQGFCT